MEQKLISTFTDTSKALTAIEYVKILVRSANLKAPVRGDTVVCIEGNVPFSIGQGSEDTAGLAEVTSGGNANIPWILPGTNRPTVFKVKLINLVRVTDFLDLLSRVPTELFPAPSFLPGDIGYVIGNRKAATLSYPILNSDYESDIKIVEGKKSEFGLSFKYTAISPNFGTCVFYQEDLIHASEKLKYIYTDYCRFEVKEDLLPFFHLGEVVIRYNNKLHNILNTVSVPMNEELLKNLTPTS